MSNDIAKTPKGSAPAAPTQDAASRLKHHLMQDVLGRMFGKADEKPTVPGTPRVLFAVANHAHGPGWDRAKLLQRQMFDVAAGSGLQMKFACWGPDNSSGVRRFRITKRWIPDPDEMAGLMDRSECNCGCYVHMRSVLERAVEENKDQTMRAVVITVDAFHDDQDQLDEAAIFANQLRRAGTKVFLFQLSNDPVTAHKLKYLARVSGAIHLPFDLRTQEQQFLEMWRVVSAYATGGEEAVKKAGGPAGTLLLEHLKQEPMPVIEARENVRVKRDT